MKELLRSIPPIHALQKHSESERLKEKYGLNDEQLTTFLQKGAQDLRTNLINGNEELSENINLEEEVLKRVTEQVHNWHKPNLKRVLNATGTILHTNLGRARLSDAAMKRVIEVASYYSNLEYHIGEGKRGSRHDIVEDLIKELTGAEAAMVVNNNAAAVYMVLRAFAQERDVIVSRGELVEIGGSFRVSSIMEESGARLVEVGTTNKTHPYDYEKAITEQTAMLMKVHTSNFKIYGFTESVDRSTLADLSHKHNKIYFEDLGSGALFPFDEIGLGEEPVVRTVLRDGADLISFSGDKLLGGPQAGVIAGKKAYIDRLKKHQLARVLRVDKMTLAALEGTMKSYAKGEEEQIPVVRDMKKTQEQIKGQVDSFLSRVGEFTNFELELMESEAQVGGGTMPEVLIPSAGIALNEITVSAETIEHMLRNHETSVIARFHQEQLFLDFRTLTVEEQSELASILKAIDHQL